MKLAEVLARGACLAVRTLVALHPRDFRRAFGRTVIEETDADLQAAASNGATAAAAAAMRALVDTASGVLAERAAPVNAARRSMQNAFMSDVRHAVRSLARDRGFTAVALGTFSVGLALCVVVAVLVNAYLLRGLPYPESHRLYDVRYGSPANPAPTGMETLDWRSLSDVLELSIAWDLDNFNLRGAPYPESLQGTWVTPDYMEGFAVRPAFGRGFQPADFQAGQPSVAIISHRLWQSRFNGDPAVIGRTFDAYMNDRPNEIETFTIVGVLTANHWHLNAFTEILSPLRAPTHPYVVRLRADVTPAAAAERITALVRSGSSGLAAGWRVELRSSHAAYVQQIRPLLLAVTIATSLVLLIACANVSVLLTVRATRRRREMSVRQALGATSGQITRASAAEPLVLALAATTLGLALAWITIRAVAPVLDHYLGRAAPGGAAAIRLEDPITLAALAVGLLAIAICAIVPIVVATRSPLSLVLSGGQKGSTEGPAQRRARSVLIAIEVAACLTLLVGAGLTIQSALGILRVEIGLDAGHVQVGRFALRQRAYPDGPTRAGFYERVLARAGQLSGAEGLAFTTSWPLQAPPDREVGSGSGHTTFSTRAGIVGVTPDYFSVLRIPLHDGRAFTTGDRIGTERVAIISRTLAARLWPSGGAIGQQLRVATATNSPQPASPATYSIVGIVGDIRHAHTDDDLADVYVPLLQSPSPSVFVYLRVAGDGSAAERDLRLLLASLDADVGLGAPRRLADILDLQRAGSRLLVYLLVVFSVFASCLALVGIYGVIAYTVKQREREIAVRLAIGADRGLITRMFVAQGAVVLLTGVTLGLGGAIGLGRVLQAQLFRVQPADPLVMAGAALGFVLCGLIAVALPARAAASLDPARALKD